MWEVLETAAASAEKNMRLDEELLNSLGERQNPILHLYEWASKSATYGYFLRPERFLNLEKAKERGVSLARRPTGGGVVFHIWDFAFSVLVPRMAAPFSENVLENYAYINDAVLRAVSGFMGGQRKLELVTEQTTAKDPHSAHFCMARPTKYDLIFQGKKIAGAAQRKKKGGFLHQGTISLVMPPKKELEELLLPGTNVVEATLNTTYPLLGERASQAQIQQAKRELRYQLQAALRG